MQAPFLFFFPLFLIPHPGRHGNPGSPEPKSGLSHSSQLFLLLRANPGLSCAAVAPARLPSHQGRVRLPPASLPGLGCPGTALPSVHGPYNPLWVFPLLLCEVGRRHPSGCLGCGVQGCWAGDPQARDHVWMPAPVLPPRYRSPRWPCTPSSLPPSCTPFLGLKHETICPAGTEPAASAAAAPLAEPPPGPGLGKAFLGDASRETASSRVL